jgi:hypothetical protein
VFHITAYMIDQVLEKMGKRYLLPGHVAADLVNIVK